MVQEPYEDILVVYPAEEPGQFVAHSIKTDQIGMGSSLHEALIEALNSLTDLFEEAKRDHRVEIWREAPSEITAMLSQKNAQRMPDDTWRAILNRFAGNYERGEDYWEPIPENLFEDEEDGGLIWRDVRAEDLHFEMA